MFTGMKIVRIVPLMIGILMNSLSVKNQVHADEYQQFFKDNNSFAVELYQKLSRQKGNLFLSPYSISTALAMTYAGARGETQKQMAGVLHFTLEQKKLHASFSDFRKLLNTAGEQGDFELITANSLWLQEGYPFKNEFLSLIKDAYGSSLNTVDYIKQSEQARVTINAWVEKNTREKIKDLIQKGMIDRLTRLVLANAIYFKGIWREQFDKAQTTAMPFYTTVKESKQAQFMHLKKDFGYAQNTVCQILELQYKGGQLSMLVLLPVKKDGLASLESALSADKLSEWCGTMETREVKVFLPKFTMTSEFSLKQTLAAMGMAEPFSNTADFSGMSDRKDLQISEVVHKAFVEVNEKGTEAAAATAVMMRAYAAPPTEIVEFKADHPFVFIIRETGTNAILFIGRCALPEQK